jgi:rRNA maturation RNase YbeY
MPRLAFEGMARAILPSGYQISLVVCGDKLARKMNIKYRNKNYYPNVLSFPIDKLDGEIFLNVRKAEREAKLFNVTLNQRLALLFVHGCFHLKGLDHSDKMEREEQKVLKKFGLAHN